MRERYWSGVPTCDPGRVHPFPGKWVVFEGIEGGGKGLLVQNIKAWLEEISGGREVVTTYEPYSEENEMGRIGRDIRAILRAGVPVHAETIQTLFVHNRYDHKIGLVIPALGRGAFVLQERGKPSTDAYTIAGFPKEHAHAALHWVDARHRQILGQHYYLPDLLIFLKIGVETCIARTGRDAPTHAAQYAEREKIQRLVDAYEIVAEHYAPIAPVVIDAEQSPEAVRDAVQAAILERFFLEKKTGEPPAKRKFLDP